jgi:hypothetical protein
VAHGKRDSATANLSESTDTFPKIFLSMSSIMLYFSYGKGCLDQNQSLSQEVGPKTQIVAYGCHNFYRH